MEGGKEKPKNRDKPSVASATKNRDIRMWVTRLGEVLSSCCVLRACQSVCCLKRTQGGSYTRWVTVVAGQLVTTIVRHVQWPGAVLREVCHRSWLMSSLVAVTGWSYSTVKTSHIYFSFTDPLLFAFLQWMDIDVWLNVVILLAQAISLWLGILSTYTEGGKYSRVLICPPIHFLTG